jgi:hypothetical protein
MFADQPNGLQELSNDDPIDIAKGSFHEDANGAPISIAIPRGHRASATPCWAQGNRLLVALFLFTLEYFFFHILVRDGSPTLD